jgi:tetratricopeptide (TPR) repeat protein
MLHLKFVFLPVFCCSLAVAQSTAPISPVDLRIAAARKQVDANPKSSAAFNDLAFALIRKGRDFQDEAIYREADSAINQSLRLTPDNYDARKLRVAVLLGTDRPVEALKLETELNHKLPDDIAGWALLVDANAAVGNYDQAEHAAQWVLDLRPGSALGFEKAAALREVFGDAEGSSEFLDEAVRRSSQNDADQRAWLLTQKARLVLASGNSKAAAALLAEATRLFPDSQLALAGLAQVKTANGEYQEAASLLEKRYHRVPSSANLYDWAEALAKAGQAQAAALQFKNFESKALAEAGKSQSARLRLIRYYADVRRDPAQALLFANKAVAERHDVATLDAYAWALYRNGQFAEAKVQMDKAIAVGVRNAEYFCHAGHISDMAKDGLSSARYSKELSAMPGNTCSVEAPLQSASEVKP